jgi:hypothetical protein
VLWARCVLDEPDLWKAHMRRCVWLNSVYFYPFIVHCQIDYICFIVYPL